MDPDEPNPVERPGSPERKRPLLLSLLCLFTWIYYGLLAIFLLLALCYSGWITGVIRQYIPEQNGSKGLMILLFSGLFMLHAAGFSGVILMWNLRRTGYYIFSVSTLLITLFHLFRPEISWLSTAVYVILVFLFSMLIRQMHVPASH